MSYDEYEDILLRSWDDIIDENYDSDRELHYCIIWQDVRNRGKKPAEIDEIRGARIPDEIMNDKAKCPYWIEGEPLAERLKRRKRDSADIDPVTGAPFAPPTD